jgi:hypothetical protein
MSVKNNMVTIWNCNRMISIDIDDYSYMKWQALGNQNIKCGMLDIKKHVLAIISGAYAIDKISDYIREDFEKDLYQSILSKNDISCQNSL